MEKIGKKLEEILKKNLEKTLIIFGEYFSGKNLLNFEKILIAILGKIFKKFGRKYWNLEENLEKKLENFENILVNLKEKFGRL